MSNNVWDLSGPCVVTYYGYIGSHAKSFQVVLRLDLYPGFGEGYMTYLRCVVSVLSFIPNMNRIPPEEFDNRFRRWSNYDNDLSALDFGAFVRVGSARFREWDRWLVDCVRDIDHVCLLFLPCFHS